MDAGGYTATAAIAPRPMFDVAACAAPTQELRNKGV